MLISPVANNFAISKIQSNNTENKGILSQKTVNTTLPSFADAKSLANINFKAKRKFDINKRDSGGETDLMHAIKSEREDIVRDFLAHPDIDINIRDNYGNTSLIIATEYEDTDIVEALLEHSDIDVNAKNQWSKTALMEAAERDNKRIVKRLLKHPDIDVNVKDKNGKTALITASLNGHDAIVEELLQHPDIDVNASDNRDWTPLFWACHDKYTDVVKQFIKHPDTDVNIQSDDGYTALMMAAIVGYPEMVRAILQHPDVNVKIKNSEGKNALSYANGEIAKMIRAYKRGVDKRTGVNKAESQNPVSDINLQDDDGNTPLISESRKGNIDEVENLLKNPDININIPNKEGNTALIYASYRGDAKVVEKLFEHHDIDVNAQNVYGTAALMCASAIDNADIVEKLLQHPDINVNLKGEDGNTALIWASINDNADVVEKLLQHPDVNVKIKNNEGKNALSYANGEIAKMIRAYKRGVDKRSDLIQKQPKKIVEKTVDVSEAKEQAIREAVTGKIREEEHIAARKEYEEKNKALDNLINNYQSILAEDISAERETLESGFRTLYGVKSDDLPENMGFGEQMIYVVDILSKHKAKLSSVSAESPKNITRALQDKSGKISNDGLKFLDRVLQVSDKKCSENDLISSIDAVKNDKGLLDMEKVSFFIANLAWGQSKITDVIKKVENYTPKKFN